MHIRVDTSEQIMELFLGGGIQRRYPVSTAKNGLGEQQDSGCTPRGLHYVRCKIGAGLSKNTIFIARRPQEIGYSSDLEKKKPGEDWILSRILWLSGLQCGMNRLGPVDTMRRYIYIHGTPPSGISGKPESKGCIRMFQNDIIELFDLITVGCRVFIY